MTSTIPVAPRRPHTWVRPSGNVEDPYAWLLQKDDSETLKYLADENTFCNQWFTNRTNDIDEIFSTIKTRIQEDDASHPVSHAGWWYTSRTETGKSYAIHSRGRAAATATENVLIDENVEADGYEYFSLGSFEVSNNTRLLAWSSDVDGSEHFTLRIRDTATDSDLADEITDTAFGGTAWSSDDEWLFYVTPDEQMRPWQVWRHQVGTAVTDDVMVYEDTDERFFVGVAATRSGQWIMIESSSKTSSETWILNASTPTAALMCVAPRAEDIEYTVDHWGTELAITTNRNAIDFQVMTASTTTPSEWKPFLPHIAGERITQFECFQSFAVLQRWVNGQQIISLVNRDASMIKIAILDEPHEVELDTNPDFDTDGIRLSYQSLTVPHTTTWYSCASKELTTLKQVQVNACNLDNYVSERLWATSHDGARVPVDIVRHRDTPLDGTAPAMVYVYGAYEISVAPWFSVARLSLLDRGWVWALAHPRGGGEMGRDWYLQGRLQHKRNTFIDTIAVATLLAEHHICDGNKIVVRGASAGGLTVGACITMQPTRFAGAIAEVPFVDVVSTMSDPTLPLTVTEWEEWGDPRTEPFAS
jgi:oligopeptidase B